MTRQITQRMSRASRRIGLWLTGGAIGLVALGVAAQPRATLGLDYVMSVAGLEVAQIGLQVSPAGPRTEVALTVRNSGLANFVAGDTLTSMRSTVVDGVLEAVRPVTFDVVYRKPDRTREIKLSYAPGGALVDISILNKGRPRASSVPDALQAGTVDPLTALVKLQAWLRQSRTSGDSITIPVFEGRKRLDLEVRFEGRSASEQRLSASLVGLHGFDPGEALVTLEGEPRRWLDVRANLDPHPVPTSIIGNSGLPARIELKR